METGLVNVVTEVRARNAVIVTMTQTEADRLRAEYEANPLRPIEWEFYKPAPDRPGYVVFDRRLTVRELCELINERLKLAELTPDEYGFSYTPAQYEGWENEPIPEHRWFACFAVTGSSEGYYIHIDLVSKRSDGPDPCRCGHADYGYHKTERAPASYGGYDKHRCRGVVENGKPVGSLWYDGTRGAKERHRCQCEGYIPALYNGSLHISLYLAKCWSMDLALKIAAACTRMLA